VIGDGLYSLVRNAVPTKRSLGYAHARTIVHIESVLHIDGEQAVNHALNRIGPLIVGMNYYYAVFHFVITMGVLVWVYVQHPLAYRASRTWLFATTVLALVGFYAYPLAPPRLLPGAGFIDTLVVHHTWGSLASGELAKVSNQYAAMPSMHIGWSLWCALTVFSLTKRTWLRRAALAYPIFTLAVIIGTANHFFLDAAGGVLTRCRRARDTAYPWSRCAAWRERRDPNEVTPPNMSLRLSSDICQRQAKWISSRLRSPQPVPVHAVNRSRAVPRPFHVVVMLGVQMWGVDAACGWPRAYRRVRVDASGADDVWAAEFPRCGRCRCAESCRGAAWFELGQCTHVPAVTLSQWIVERGKTYVVGHGGSSDVLPENTMQACEGPTAGAPGRWKSPRVQPPTVY